MLTAYQKAVLLQELASADYNGMTADQGWAWLMDPVVTQTQEPSHLRLTPLLVASILGPLKAEGLAARIKVFLPTTADALFAVGADLSDPMTGPFLDAMVDGVTVLAADVVTLKALGTRTVTVTETPRFNSRFYPVRWTHVAPNGSAGTNSDLPIRGFPNTIDRIDFDAAWTEVRG